MEQPVLIFGAGGLGKVVLEIFQSNDVVVYGFLDDDTKLHGTMIGEVAVLGSTDDQGFLKLIGQKCQAFIAGDDKRLKQKLVSMLLTKRKVMPVNAIHQNAYLSPSSAIGHGNLIGAGVVVNCNALIGNHNVMHAQCTLDYGSRIKDYVTVGAGSTIGAEVTIEEGAFIGAGATLVSGISIGANARIGTGSVVIANVGKNETVFGNPAQKVKGQ
jgi:sugar O-acyltransferase (sialic acid O-acetyltransferase NeuD family)